MTKILEKAIAKARALPAEDQDVIGAVILALAEEELTRIGDLDDETRASIRKGLDQARRGESVSEDEISALWLEALRSEIEIGVKELDAGLWEPLDGEDVIRQARADFAAALKIDER